MTIYTKLLYLSVALTFISFLGNAQIPTGYYSDASGLSGESLKSALHSIIDDHSTISYTAVENALKFLDEDPNNSNNVILLYKQTSIPKSSFGGGVDDWNREHIWPSSHGDFGTSAPEGTDLFHMRPTDASVNSDRGDKDFDDCQVGGTQHSEATLCYYTSNAWEPPDAVKGDIARALFYMEVRYEGDAGEVDLEIKDFYTTTSTSPGHLGVLSTLMSWHENDPVDAKEQTRNNNIYNNYQGNRNPFIDHPEYVGLIWGDGFEPEPASHASDFSAHTITISWVDAVGGVLPEAYLVRMNNSGFENIQVPVDGSPVADDFWNQNVGYGTGKCIFKGLTENTVYYFKIYGYTGSGVNIDYKTDGDIQQISIQAK
ncbi:MAG: endonuclease [Bacteroidales bacterium]|nr:endonuclease [Bacteroidales bacterium]MCF8403190.1 endonuclease [Bacteroidales bacterium]